MSELLQSKMKGVLDLILEDRIPMLVWWPDMHDFRRRAEELGKALRSSGVRMSMTPLYRARPLSTFRPAHRAALLLHLGQVHLDLSSEMITGGTWQEKVATAKELVTRAAGPDALVLTDLFTGTFEGTEKMGAEKEETFHRSWWLEQILETSPEKLPEYRDLGKGVGVAVMDHPIDPDHPALVGRVLDPLDAWIMPHYPRIPWLPDDHGTGSAGLVGGRTPSVALGVAPSAEIQPVFLSPGFPLKGIADRIRTLCRGLDLIRHRQMEGGSRTEIKVLSQQFVLGPLRSAAKEIETYEAALRVMEGAYSIAAGVWGMAVLISAGSNPKAVWPVWPAGLAGATSVGALDEENRFVGRSPLFGIDLAACVSRRGNGVFSAAARGGYLRQGQATSPACPLAAGAVAAVISSKRISARRALRLLRRQGEILPSGATRIRLGWLFRSSSYGS